MEAPRRTKRPRADEEPPAAHACIKFDNGPDANDMVKIHLTVPRQALRRAQVFEQAAQCGGSTALPDDVDALLLWLAGALKVDALDSPASYRQALVPKVLKAASFLQDEAACHACVEALALDLEALYYAMRKAGTADSMQPAPSAAAIQALDGLSPDLQQRVLQASQLSLLALLSILPPSLHLVAFGACIFPTALDLPWGTIHAECTTGKRTLCVPDIDDRTNAAEPPPATLFISPQRDTSRASGAAAMMRIAQRLFAFTHLTALAVEGFYENYTDPASSLLLLANALQLLPQLRQLAVTNGRTPVDSQRTFLTSLSALTNLRALDLTHMRIDEAFLALPFCAPAPAKLTALHLAGNDAGLDALAAILRFAGDLPTLQQLSLSVGADEEYLQLEDDPHLLPSGYELTALTALLLDQRTAGDSCSTDVVIALRRHILPRLADLQYYGGPLGDDEIEVPRWILSEWLSPCLTRLEASHVEFTPVTSTVADSGALRLQTLELLECVFEAATAMPDMFRDVTTLRRLQLYSCELGVSEQTAAASLTHLTALTALCLRGFASPALVAAAVVKLPFLEHLEVCEDQPFDQLVSAISGLANLTSLALSAQREWVEIVDDIDIEVLPTLAPGLIGVLLSQASALRVLELQSGLGSLDSTAAAALPLASLTRLALCDRTIDHILPTLDVVHILRAAHNLRTLNILNVRVPPHTCARLWDALGACTQLTTLGLHIGRSTEALDSRFWACAAAGLRNLQALACLSLTHNPVDPEIAGLSTSFEMLETLLSLRRLVWLTWPLLMSPCAASQAMQTLQQLACGLPRLRALYVTRASESMLAVMHGDRLSKIMAMLGSWSVPTFSASVPLFGSEACDGVDVPAAERLCRE